MTEVTLAIELAPNWKRSLTLTHPLILVSTLIPDATIGAMVTLPLTLRARSGASFPRVVEIPGGVLLRTGAANPGIEKFLREHRRVWLQSKIPIIVAFASQGAPDWATMAARVESVEGVGGIELQFNAAMDAADAICAVRAATELPILAKLDLDNATEIAVDCVAAGANALVIARAPRGMVMVDGKPWYGRLYSPTIKPLVLNVVKEIGDLRLEIPVIVCGGVHSADDVREFLAAGACAVELDSAAWVDPLVVERVAKEFV